MKSPRPTCSSDAAHRPLRAADLLSTGPLWRLGRNTRVLDTVESTNSVLRAHAINAGDGAIVCAEFQTDGRGRLGRKWESPRGAAVMLSVLLVELPHSPIVELGALLGSLAACEAIERTTDCTPQVRWPNDLVIGSRKLGGVLAETFPWEMGTGDLSAIEPVERRVGVIIGIGVNCLQHRGHFVGELAERATSLEIESRAPIDRAALAAALVARLDFWINEIDARPLGDVRMRVAWHARCSDFGTRATLEHDGRQWSGTLLDIDENGDLIVQLDHGGRRCFAAATTTRVC